MFNEYQWENYLKAGGNKIVTIFEKIHELKCINKFCESIEKLHKCYCPEKAISKSVKDDIVLFFENVENEKAFSLFDENEKYNFESGCRKVWNTLREGLELKNDSIDLDVKNLPVKKDYKGRFMYYGKVCEAFQNFRKENNLSIAELWAFLYDYAPKYVGSIQYIKSDL